MGPYHEALSGLREQIGSEVPAYVLPAQTPLITADTRIVVAFGMKAIKRGYPASVKVVQGLAPGMPPNEDGPPPGSAVYVSMLPTAGETIARIKDLQPGLRKLGVLWASETVEFSPEDMKKEAGEAGVTLLPLKVASPEDIPGALRTMHGQAEALWVPLDPTLLTAGGFATIKEFSLNNGLPLYVPSDRLAKEGATAAVFASFSEAGRTAAKAVAKLLERLPLQGTVYPAKAETALNLPAAERVGLKLDARSIKEAVEVIR